MANVGPTIWYVRDNAPTSTLGWSAVTAWAATTSKAPGALVRQSAPTAGNERVYVNITSSTQNTGGSEPTWTLTKGAVQATDGAVVWQECTGQPGVNGGPASDTPTWAQQKASSSTISVGLIIQNNAGTCLFINKTGTTIGAAEPSFNLTAGATTSDNAVTWVSLGAPANFAFFAAPFAKLAQAIASTWGGTAGHSFYFGDDHTEVTTGAFSAGVGTITTPQYFYSIDHTVSTPTVLAGAILTFSTTMTLLGSWYADGIIFRSGTGNAVSSNISIGNSAAVWLRFNACSLRLVSTSASTINIFNNSTSATKVELIATDIQFGNASSSLALGLGSLIWRNTPTAIGGTTPTTLFGHGSSGSHDITIIEGVDLSAIGSGKTIVSANAISGMRWYFINCKIDAAATLAATPTNAVAGVDFVYSAGSGISYDQRRFHYQGTLTPETTIVRTGGASDGTTIAWKIVTTANAKWVQPFECFPISAWNDTINGSTVTATIYGIWGGGAVPNNDDIWVDAEYMGSGSTPIASVATCTKSSNIATASALTADASTWGGSTTAFKMVVTFIPLLAGYVRFYVRAAKVSSTFYVDPKPVLS